MILFNYFNEEIKQIKELFNQRIKHPYMMKYVEQPILDEDRLFLLYSMYQEKKLPLDRINDYMITALLVQAALDAHETVSVSNISADQVKKQRQLTVLAGDYYSSLYYFLLAKINDISMIRVLASSIQEVNESKMSFYKKGYENVSQLVEDIKIIESSLIQKVADQLNLQSWKLVASEFLFLKRLIVERDRLMNDQMVPFLDGIVNAVKKNGVMGEAMVKHQLDICDHYIIQSKLKLQSLCKHPSQLHSFILTRIDDLLVETDIVKEKVAEEG